MASSLSFYNGPDIPDPGYVPDGAVCGTDKVSIISDFTNNDDDNNNNIIISPSAVQIPSAKNMKLKIKRWIS